MDVVLIIGIAAIVAIVVGGVAASLYSRAAWRSLQRRRVLIAIETNEGPRTMRAILWERRGPLYVLRDVGVYLGSDELATSMDGEVVVERARVLWVQVIR